MVARGVVSYAGSIAGFCETSGVTIKNSVAASHYNFGSEYIADRVVGISMGILLNNYANSDMINIWYPTTEDDSDTTTGADITPLQLFTQSTYTNLLPSWDFSNIWDIRSDSVNLPYFKWQSSPVAVKNVSKFSVSLNAYTNLDSVKIYLYRTREHLYTIINPIQGESFYDVYMPNINIGDSLAFYSYENGKKASYPVFHRYNPEFTTGDGSLNNPFQIKTRTELEYLHSYLGSTNDNHNKHFKIMKDIDLSESPWIPIGYDILNSFRGKLHGNNKKLIGINIGQNGGETYKYTGLFGYLSNEAYIENLYIVGGNIKGWDENDEGFTGSIAGFIRCNTSSESIKITGCTNSADIEGTGVNNSSTGGIAGYIYGPSINIENCINYGNVSRDINIGGIIGTAENTDNYINIKKCINHGHISGYSDNINIGGIIGKGKGLSTAFKLILENCANDGLLYGETGSSINIGGIIGRGNNNITIKDSYNSSIILSDSGQAIIGGIAGYLFNDNNQFDIEISNTYSYGSINANNNQSKAGGLIGYVASDGVTVKNSVSALEFIKSGLNSNTHRIVGETTGSILLLNNYANSEMLINNNIITTGIGTSTNEGENKNLRELYSQSTYSTILNDWNFTNIWELRNDNLNLPYFRWQAAPANINEIYRDSLRLNIYRSNDSITVFSIPGYITEEVIEGFANRIIETIAYNMIDKNVGDSLIFINHENNKDWQSYPVTVQIMPRRLAITADPKFACSGFQEQLLTYTVTPELIPGDILTGELEREQGSDAGEYDILQGTLNNPNYIIDFTGNTYTIYPIPTVNNIEDKTVCSGTEIESIELNSSTSGTTFYWTGGVSVGLLNNSNDSEIPAFIAEYEGTASISTIINVIPRLEYPQITCSGNASTFNITVVPLPTLNHIDDIKTCSGTEIQEITLNSRVTGTIFHWTGGDALNLTNGSSTNSIPAFTPYSQSGSINANIKIVSDFSDHGLTCKGDSIEFTVFVNPVPDINPIEDKIVCSGTEIEEIPLTGTVMGTVFTWAGGSALNLPDNNSIDKIPAFTPNNETTTTSSIIVIPSYTNAGFSCTGSFTEFSVTSVPVPVINQIEDKNICSGTTVPEVPLSSNVSGTIFNWTGGDEIGLPDGSSSSRIPEFTVITNDEITETITITPEFTYGQLTCRGDSINFTISISYPVSIITQPNHITDFCFDADVVRISVQATGSVNSYQWYKDGESINGTSSQLIINNPDSSDEGIYYVEISGSCNTISSNEAKLRFLHNAEGLVGQKWNNMLYVSDKNKEFEKEGYQWFKDGVEIMNATKQYYSAGEYETNILDFNALYHVKIPLKEPVGEYIYSCPHQFERKESRISVFPNPVMKNETLNINIAGQNTNPASNIKICTITGQTLEIYNTYDEMYSIPVKLEPGIYIIKIRAGETEESFKINVMQ